MIVSWYVNLRWYHTALVYIRLHDWLTEALYAVLVRCRTRSLIFLCTKCRVHYEECKYQCAHTNDERLASTCQIELAHQQVAGLSKEAKCISSLLNAMSYVFMLQKDRWLWNAVEAVTVDECIPRWSFNDFIPNDMSIFWLSSFLED